MIEIGVALSAATQAYGAVRKMIAAGKDLEDTVGQLSQWFTAYSDINEAEHQAKNPGLFAKIVHSKSVEAQSIEIFAARQKMRSQEKELREIVLYAYGADAWREMIQIRRQVAKERQDAIHKQTRRRKEFLDNCLMLGAILVLAVLLYGMAYFVFQLLAELK
jgi:NAD+--asparagine ADP-ribosyltransferase